MLLLLATPMRVFCSWWARQRISGESQSAQSADAIQVDETMRRLGLKVEVSRQRLAFGIKTTGQIESLPNQQVEVTTQSGER